MDAYAEIRNSRIPKAPHDPSKPAIMKHRDLPSVPIAVFYLGLFLLLKVIDIKLKNTKKKPKKTDIDCRYYNSHKYRKKMLIEWIRSSSSFQKHLKGGSVSRSLSTTDSSAFSSTDEYVPFNKVLRTFLLHVSFRIFSSWQIERSVEKERKVHEWKWFDDFSHNKVEYDVPEGNQ